ncbi:bromodomain-containing protein 7-like [Anneissia japonica]|uniref:bromodomain-containing protein 7-like n=1 Tax=Anneissia japonica TaxID=1529436 RepID=UPI001425AB13|nr:bromodomain-containing protein 7-like [Anneissia japonica]
MGKKHKKHRAEKKPVVEEKPQVPKLVLKVSRGITTRKKDEVVVEAPPPQVDSSHEESPRDVYKKKRRRKKEEKPMEIPEEKKRKVEESYVEEDHVQEESEELEEPVAPAVSNEEEEMEGVEPLPSEVTEEEEEPPAREDEENIDWNSTPARRAFLMKFVEKRTAPTRHCRGKEDQDPSVSPLQKILDSLQKTLQRKDQNEFFSWPVNDVIAPGYSSIIAYPMDFSTMHVKIDNNEYGSINEYKADFVLMCENAMTYNRPETIYYKAAKRLLNVGIKLMNKERISHLKRTHNYVDEVETKPRSRAKPKAKHSEALASDAGVSAETQPHEGKTKAGDKKQARDKVPLGHYDPNGEGFTENLEPHEVVKEALAAAKAAKDRLTVRNPHGKIGFLRKDEHGTTTLGVLNPSTAVNTDLKVANLGLVVGKLTNGSGSLPGFKEDKHNKINPVTYLTYGPFSSYAPSYDSSFSNISKEESDLLYSTYADEAGVQYSKSIQDFVKDAGSHVTKFVDNLLDTLTNGEHSKTMKQLRDKRKTESEMKEQANLATATEKGDTSSNKDKQIPEKEEEKITEKKNDDETSKVNGTKEKVTDIPKDIQSAVDEDVEIDFEDLRSLSNIGIDMSFLSDIEKSWEGDKTGQNKDLNSKLDSTANLIDNLEKKQIERLSRKPPAHLQFIEGPSQEESNIAEEITQQLMQLTSNAKPADVVSTPAVRKAMGIEVSLPSPGDSPKQLDASNDIDKELMDFLDSQPTTSIGEENEQEHDILSTS